MIAASCNLAPSFSAALSSQIRLPLSRRCVLALSRGTTSSLCFPVADRLEKNGVLRQGKTFPSHSSASSGHIGTLSHFERAVVVPLPGMLLAKQVFEPAQLGDALVGDASAVDAELGETVVRSAASLKEAVETLINGIRAHHPGKKVVLVGHSYGSYVALEFARRAPNLLSGLVLISTQLRADTKRTTDGRMKRVNFAYSNGVTALIDELLPGLLSPKAMTDEKKLHAIYRMAEDVGVETFAKQMSACIGRSDQRSTLSALHPSLPVFVAAGGDDKLIPATCLQEVHKELRDREMASLERSCLPAPWKVYSRPGVGHLMPLESPQELHDDLKAWAASVQAYSATTIQF